MTDEFEFIEAFDDTEINDTFDTFEELYIDASPSVPYSQSPSLEVAPPSWPEDAVVSLWKTMDFITLTVGKFILLQS